MNLDELIDSWTCGSPSPHLTLALYGDGENGVVPGCDCVTCLTIGAGGSAEDAAEAEVVLEALSRLPPRKRRSTAVAWASERSRQRPDMVLPSPGVLAARAAGVPGTVRYRRYERKTVQIQRARETPLLEVVSRLGLGEAKRKGREWYVRCPLHLDESPSLRMNLEKSVWYCDPCDTGGDGITLVMLVRGLPFLHAVDFLGG